MPITRSSFIQMSKLTNLKGRISYISSHARQENLYAVYETTERKFWRELAKCNQEEFVKSGTEGTCIEARELIIALPESLVEYEPNLLLKIFTEHFRQKYDVECISALHHNKRKTNYHIHLIFSERRLLGEPIEKIATRNMFYDEKGKHVRTKKEILDETGKVRGGCKIIPKGRVYERKVFSIKDSRFKGEGFLEEVKHSYTNLINIYVKNNRERLQVFDRKGAYLPMKKIGKNNPKEEQIAFDNEMRKRWNQTVDRALLSGVPEMQVVQVKRTEISSKVKESVKQFGKRPQLFATIILLAVKVLELLIRQVMNMAFQGRKQVRVQERNISRKSMEKPVFKQKNISEPPRKSSLAAKYPRLSEIYDRLDEQNTAIYHREQQLSGLEQEYTNTKGIFRGKQRKELQQQIGELQEQIDNMKRYLSVIAKEHGYQTVQEFLNEYSTAKAENTAYQKAVADWKKQYGEKPEQERIRARLEYHKRQIRTNENSRPHAGYSIDRGAR